MVKWVASLQGKSELMTLEHINNRATSESIGKMQREITKGNAKSLD